MKKKSDKIYNDKIILLFLLPIISFIANIVGTDYNLSFIVSFQYLKIYLLVFIEVVAVWSFFRYGLFLLDQRIPLNSENSRKRFLLQLGIALLGYIIFQFIFVYFEYYAFGWTITPRIFINSDLPIDITFIFLVNLIYSYWGHIAYTQKTKVEAKWKPSKNKAGPIEIKKNKTTIFLELNQIAYIYISNSITYLTTTDKETHIFSGTLNEMHELLGHETYYRVNRQFLISKLAIQSYKILPNRQIQIHLMPPSEIDCKLNKNNSKDFKKWLNAHN